MEERIGLYGLERVYEVGETSPYGIVEEGPLTIHLEGDPAKPLAVGSWEITSKRFDIRVAELAKDIGEGPARSQALKEFFG